jgi:integrase
MKLTKGAVTALKTEKPDAVFWDDNLPGLGCRVRDGKKSWLIQYRVGKQQRRESLGDIRRVTLDDARGIARKRFAQVELGVDPAADRAKADAAVAASKLTFGRILDGYVASREGIVRATTLRDISRYSNVALAPLRNCPIGDLTRALIAAELRTIAKTSGPVAASQARAYASAALSWGMREGLIDSNVAIGTNNPAAGVKSRDRILSDGELAVVWNTCNGATDFGRIIRLLILLGCRRQEVGGLKWDEVDLDAGTMTISGSRTKSGNVLALTLPDAALEILQSMQSTPRRNGGCIFGGASGFTSWSAAMTALRRRIAEPTMAQWSLHDLRRTFRSGLGRLGTPPHIAERLIGHSVGGTVQKIYDRYTYASEMRDALSLWSAHVLAIVEGRKPKVLTLAQERHRRAS